MEENVKMIGGQALPNGVMMRSKEKVAVAVRCADGSVRTASWRLPLRRKASKVPVLRGVTQMGMALGMGVRAYVKAFQLSGTVSAHLINLLKYHGAEHKAIFCYEKGKEMTIDNVREQSRFHPRCGTCMAVTLYLLDTGTSLLVPKKKRGTWVDLLRELACVGTAYEIHRYAWKHPGKLSDIVLKPGLLAQHITTQEPDEPMLECAIRAVEEVK